MDFIITKEEVVNHQWVGFNDQVILSLLKSKGAPINGLIHLQPDFENYEWQRIDLPEKNIITFKVVHKKDLNK